MPRRNSRRRSPPPRLQEKSAAGPAPPGPAVERSAETVGAELDGQTVLAGLRVWLIGASWSACRKWLRQRRVLVNGALCVQESRRLQRGDVVRLLGEPLPPPPRPTDVRLVYVDEHLVVAEKPSGVVTTRRPEERHWPEAQKRLAPTLDELVGAALSAGRERRPGSGRRPPPVERLWRVHRLDRDTSGLVAFARTESAAQQLIEQFARHAVERVYLAIVHGRPVAETIRTKLVRDRGDGLRGSGPHGAPAVTHVRPLETWGPYSLVECRLETGRTHQIRIHLAERGCLVCGETRYQRRPDGAIIADESGAPRLALHATRLGFRHPVTNAPLNFAWPLPPDLAEFAARLRAAAAAAPPADRA